METETKPRVTLTQAWNMPLMSLIHVSTDDLLHLAEEAQRNPQHPGSQLIGRLTSYRNGNQND
jgi:hypothetical protein